MATEAFETEEGAQTPQGFDRQAFADSHS